MNKLKISALSENALNEREMNALAGGRNCGCGCMGPSSTEDNGCANFEGGKNGLSSPVNKKDLKMVIHD